MGGLSGQENKLKLVHFRRYINTCFGVLFSSYVYETKITSPFNNRKILDWYGTLSPVYLRHVFFLSCKHANLSMWNQNKNKEWAFRYSNVEVLFWLHLNQKSTTCKYAIRTSYNTAVRIDEEHAMHTTSNEKLNILNLKARE